VSEISIVWPLTALVWLVLVGFYPRQGMWFVLLWVGVQGWFQINVFDDSAATVLLYEFMIFAIYLMFFVRALRFPRDYGPPRVMATALPFAVWILLIVPFSVEQGGVVLTGIGLRTYLFPIPLVWVGYCAFRSRREIEAVGALLSLESAAVGLIAALQFMNLVTPSGSVIEVPKGFVSVGVLRPPGTFSSPGHFGMYILAMIPLGVGFLGLKTNRWRNICYKLGLGGAALSLVVNSQRATVVLLSVCLPLLAFFARSARAVKAVLVATGMAAIGVVIGLSVVGDAFSRRIRAIMDDASYTLRIAPIERMTAAFGNPWAGGGLGIASPGTIRLDLDALKSAESFYAALVYQMGLPGLLFFALLLAALLTAGYRALSGCREQDIGVLAAAILVYELAICLDSWSYDPLHYPPSRVLFWFWAGVLLSLPHLHGRGKPSPARASVFIPRSS
jgi:hypothetical protein